MCCADNEFFKRKLACSVEVANTVQLECITLSNLKRTTANNDVDCCELWYLCQKPEDSRFMIRCDIQERNCKIWYHGDCVGVSKSPGRCMGHYDADFTCPF